MLLYFNKNIFFYLGWILMEIHICLANSDAADFSIPLLPYISLLCFAAKLLMENRYRLPEILLMASMLFTGIMVEANSGDMRVLWAAIVIIAAKNINFDAMVRLSLKVMLVCCSIFILLYSFGIIEGSHGITERGIRLSLGLGHANMCSAYYALIILQIIFCFYEKLRGYHFLVFIVGDYLIYMITKSLTGCVVTTVIILLSIIIKYFSFKKYCAHIIAMVVLVGMAFFSLAPLIYDNFLSGLDLLMTGRLHQANFYYVRYGITLFGSKLLELNLWNTDNILDMGYAKMLINNGIVFYLFVISGYVMTLYRSIKYENYKLLILTCSILVYMYTENVATFIFMNVSMLYFSTILFGDKKTERLYQVKGVGVKQWQKI